MPEEVLTGPFIELGKSLWHSDRLASLYPGLASNPEFNPTGQFGIGFYASFIIGNDIKVMSNPYNGGDRDRRVLHFQEGIRRRAELRVYDLALDGEWPYEQNTIVEINFYTDKWLAQFASLSFHGYFDDPIFSTDAKFWEYFVLSLRRLVFCLDVAVELECPNCNNVRINRTDIFRVPKEVFVREFNSVFANSEDQKISTVITPLVDTIIERKHAKSRGTIRINDSMIGIYHIGGLTVFGSSGVSGMGYSTRYVTGVHHAIPLTVARQPLTTSASLINTRKLAKKQLKHLDEINLLSPQRGYAQLCAAFCLWVRGWIWRINTFCTI